MGEKHFAMDFPTLNDHLILLTYPGSSNSFMSLKNFNEKCENELAIAYGIIPRNVNDGSGITDLRTIVLNV